MYVLGIDLGTSGCKACAVDAAGRVAAEGSVGYPTSSPQPGWAEQDPADWIGAVVEAVGKLTESGAVAPTDVAGLALSCAAHIGVLLDEHDQPLRPAILWSDQRSHQEVAELERECGDEVFQLTHQRVSTTWTLPHLVWVRRHEPDVWSQVRRVLLSKDYLLWWLTGRRVTDPATAVSAQLYDARAGQWSERLCGLAELTTDMLPQIVPPTDVAGTLTDAVAKKLGLPPATPVVVGTLDSAAETYGAGVDQPGQCLLRVATAGGAHLVLPEPHPHPRLITYPHPRQPLWYSQAGTSSCASAVRWAIDCFSSDGTLSFEDWDRLAASAPAGCEGLMFHPYLAGERCPYWNPDLRASFVGATAAHGTAHFARAVYEGTACSIRDALSALAELGIGPAPFVAVGGGTASGIWMQILADVLDRPLDIAPAADSSYGAALLGLEGLGLRAKSEAPEHAEQPTGDKSSVARRYAPRETESAAYDQLFERYRRVQQALAPLYGTDSS